MLNIAFMLSGEGGGNWIITVVMIVLIIGMFFFMNRSQKKRDKEAAEMRDSLQVGDEITTIGGIIGKVVSIKGETFVLETTKDKTKIRFLKGAIRTVDVKAADVAAQIIEANKEPTADEADRDIEDAPAAETEDKKD